jgi:hypothetical protein
VISVSVSDAVPDIIVAMEGALQDSAVVEDALS